LVFVFGVRRELRFVDGVGEGVGVVRRIGGAEVELAFSSNRGVRRGGMSEGEDVGEAGFGVNGLGMKSGLGKIFWGGGSLGDGFESETGILGEEGLAGLGFLVPPCLMTNPRTVQLCVGRTSQR
jgi:hypothetical protein